MKVVLKVLGYTIVTIFALLALIFIWIFIQSRVNPDKVPSLFGYKCFIVLSGSMEPEIYKGDLVIVKNTDSNTLKENDIIAFRDKDGYVVTHRIVEINYDDGKKFITKGDNNNVNDADSVALESVEGIYTSKIGGLGNVLVVMQEPVTIVVVISVIILAGILWITLDNNKLSTSERKELELLRKQKDQNGYKH